MPDFSSLHFLWPLMLWVGAAVPVFALFYAYKTRKTPPVFLCLGLLLLCTSLGRPQTVLMTPVRDAMVMLVLDTSGSMRAKDLQPSRIEVAQNAARQFIEDKPRSLRVGLVTVAGTAALAQAPTEERDALLKALDYLPLNMALPWVLEFWCLWRLCCPELASTRKKSSTIPPNQEADENRPPQAKHWAHHKTPPLQTKIPQVKGAIRPSF